MADITELAGKLQSELGDHLSLADEYRIILAALRAAYAAGPERAAEIELWLRQELWEGHGHIASLYGDDGEMQCSHPECCRCWDYKRTPIADVREHVAVLRLKHADAIRAEKEGE